VKEYAALVLARDDLPVEISNSICESLDILDRACGLPTRYAVESMALEHRGGRSPHTDPASQEFEGILMSYGPERVYFLTSAGRIGVCHESVRPGDQVYLVSGKRVPYVLRPAGERGYCTLRGECYLEGAMHGELVDNGRLRDWDEIVLV
jgi:hypothetical protein